jgi:hypothetical protein
LRYLLLTSLWSILLVSQQGLLGQETKNGAESDIIFSLEGGFYEHAIQLSLHTVSGGKIYYTTNGSRPNRYSHLYRAPINIDSTQVIRAVSIQENQAGPIFGHTYFIKEPVSSFPTVSVAIDPSILFDPQKGIFMLGAHANDSLLSKQGAQLLEPR